MLGSAVRVGADAGIGSGVCFIVRVGVGAEFIGGAGIGGRTGTEVGVDPVEVSVVDAIIDEGESARSQNI